MPGDRVISSRDIDTLSPDARAWFQRFRSHAEGAGLIYLRHWIVTSFYRDQEFQDWLWAQGRTRTGSIVTWTRHSRHTEGRAWDIAIRDPKTGKIDWSVVKADVDLDHLPDYEEMAGIGRSMGLRVGMDFPKCDACHFETPLNAGVGGFMDDDHRSLERRDLEGSDHVSDGDIPPVPRDRAAGAKEG